jgi:hypothetical protein
MSFARRFANFLTKSGKKSVKTGEKQPFLMQIYNIQKRFASVWTKRRQKSKK